MAKVICPRTECKHNNNNTCKAKEVKIRAYHIHTMYQGFKRMEECLTFEETEEYKLIQNKLDEFLTKNIRKGE